MTLTKPPANRPVAVPSRRHWLLRWDSAVSRWTDRFDVCRDAGARNARVSLVVSVEVIGPDRAMIEAWVERPGPRAAVLERQVAACSISVDGSLLHVDVRSDGERVVSLSVDPEHGRLLYARSAILSRAGFAAGSFDPPTIGLPESAEVRRQA